MSRKVCSFQSQEQGPEAYGSIHGQHSWFTHTMKGRGGNPGRHLTILPANNLNELERVSYQQPPGES